ncbi:putative uncharacterized protein DDB_G0282133 isoform X2 [Eurosta solidaginis]|uniref:putative uncharacterized protein DDB_G0282133 isoform X2 n=1 Tax=Eurosta solidaginis TaxID=178769 RepID=UPI00353172AC
MYVCSYVFNFWNKSIQYQSDMINSANTVDFSTISHGSVLLQSGIMSLDKCKIVQPSKLPQSTDNRFTSTYSIQTSLVGSPYTADNKLKTDIQSAETKDIQTQPQRVQVQHLQIHPNLQNNRWSYHTFYNLSNELGRTQSHDGGAIRINNNNNLKLEKKSAFSLSSNVSVNSNNNSNTYINNNNSNINNNNNVIVTSIPNTFSQIESGKHLSGNLIVRTIEKVDAHKEFSDRRSSSFNNIDYQENAFLRIKDVHNYAKLDHYSYSNESSNSSVHDEENEDDDEDLDEDMDDNNDDAATNFERYLKNSKHFAARKDKSNRLTRMESDETEYNVDAETVHKVQNDTEGAIPSTPDHHARRPMNAFLIFCKRHRAIVKERYKSLENRAITKILGDWWASLDANDKKCFTSLAQQNKDAFFNANPNFKWYKLPAPPLRALNTRPGNTDRILDQDDEIKSTLVAEDSGTMLQKFPNDKNNHLFKLADEAQMGELSTLINCESNNNNCSANQNANALQQALGETSQFLNAYMPPSDDTFGGQSTKVRLLNENSFSSNGSEDDVLPKKSARACKGKIYQELINSGQISAVSKKVRTPKSQNYPNGTPLQTVNPSNNFHQVSLEGSSNSTASPKSKSNAKQCETYSLEGSHSNNDLASFDLEEKIKELPALNLDLYLQRKRNTKKKKKFTSKKRHSNSSASNNKSSNAVKVSNTPVVNLSSIKISESPPQQAVGSQKRKARKESITRRNVTAIENEIASVIPLANSFSTINGCYYFNESPDSISLKSRFLGEISNSTVATAANCQWNNACVNFNNDNISSTSDLLILAEVAANRTELTN